MLNEDQVVKIYVEEESLFVLSAVQYSKYIIVLDSKIQGYTLQYYSITV